MKLPVASFHVKGIVKIQNMADNFQYEEIKRERTFSLYKVANQSWIYVKDYVSVVFVNCSEEIQKSTLQQIIPNTFLLADLPQEDYVIEIEDGAAHKVGFSVIKVPKLDDDIVHVIALNIAQSVALEDFQNQVAS